MQPVEITLLGMIGITAILYLYQRFHRRSACRADAASMYRDLKAIYQDEHEHRRAGRPDFSGLDWQRYDAVRREFEGLGFRPLGSFEDVTVSRVHPEHRTLSEVYVDPSGTICAGTYSMQGRQLCEFVTEFESGRFVLTTNASLDKLTPPPAVDRWSCPERTPVSTMFAAHQDRVASARSGVEGARPLIVETIDAAIDASRRFSRLAAQYRRSVGLITEAELLSLTTGPGQAPAARLVWKEFRRLYETDHGQRAA